MAEIITAIVERIRKLIPIQAEFVEITVRSASTDLRITLSGEHFRHVIEAAELLTRLGFKYDDPAPSKRIVIDYELNEAYAYLHLPISGNAYASLDTQATCQQ